MASRRENAITSSITRRRRIQRRMNYYNHRPNWNGLLPSLSSMMHWAIFSIYLYQIILQQVLQGDTIMATTRIVERIKPYDRDVIVEDNALIGSHGKGLNFYFFSFLPTVHASSASMDVSALKSLGMSNQDIQSLLSSPVQEEEEVDDDVDDDDDDDDVDDERWEEQNYLNVDIQTEQASSVATNTRDRQNDNDGDSEYESDLEDYDSSYYDGAEESSVESLYNKKDDNVLGGESLQQGETKAALQVMDEWQEEENIVESGEKDNWDWNKSVQDYSKEEQDEEEGEDDDDDDDDDALDAFDLESNLDESDNYQNEHGGKVDDKSVDMGESILLDDEYYDDEYEEESDADGIDNAQSIDTVDRDDDEHDAQEESNPHENIPTQSGTPESFTTQVIGDKIITRKKSVSSLPSSTLPIMLLPKIGQTLIHSPIAVQIFAAGTLGNIAMSRLGWRKRKRRHKLESDEEKNGNSIVDKMVDTEARSNNHVDAHNIYEIDSDFEESDFVNNEKDVDDIGGGFGRPRTIRNYSSTNKDVENLQQTDTNDGNLQLMREEAAEHTSGATQDTFISNKQRKSKKNNRKLKLWTRKKRIDESSGSAHREFGTEIQEYVRPKPTKRKLAFFRGRQALESEVSRLNIEVDNLLKRAVEAESARDQFENDCDIAMHELREVRKEFEEVSKTNIYLKNQLVDNKKMMERAISAERLKANAELSRVREQMVEILERERRFMRAQLSKHSAEVRSMIAESVEEDPYDYVEEEYDVD